MRNAEMINFFQDFHRTQNLGDDVPVALIVKGDTRTDDRMTWLKQRLAAEQSKKNSYSIPVRDFVSEGFVRILPHIRATSSEALWERRGPEIRGFATNDTVAAVGMAERIDILDVLTGKLLRTIKHPKLGHVHTIEFSPFNPHLILIGSSAADRILEIDWTNGNIVWEWNPWAHGFSKNRLGMTIIEKGQPLPDAQNVKIFPTPEADEKMKNGEAAPPNEVWVNVVDFENDKTLGRLKRWQAIVYPNSVTYGHSPDTIVASSFKLNMIVRINKKTGSAEVVLDGLKSPHGPIPFQSGYLISDTSNGRVIFTDSKLKPQKIYDFSKERSNDSISNDSRIEWIQNTYPISESLLATIDVKRSLFYIWDPSSKSYEAYPFDPKWAPQAVLPLKSNGLLKRLAVPFSFHALFTLEEGKEIDPQVARDYSNLKMGRWKEMNQFVTQLMMSIQSGLGNEIVQSPEDWVIANVNSLGILNSTSVVARKLSKKLHLANITLDRHQVQDPESLRRYSSIPDAETRKKFVQGHLSFSDPTRSVSGKRVILIDDSIVTGSLLDEARKYLMNAGASDVKIYVAAHLINQNGASYEDNINRTALREGGVKYLANILNGGLSFYTVKLLYYALKLGKGQFKKLFSKLTTKSRINLYFYSVAYFGSDIPKNIDFLSSDLSNKLSAHFFSSSEIKRFIPSLEFKKHLKAFLVRNKYRVSISSATAMLRALSHLLLPEPLTPLNEESAKSLIETMVQQVVDFSKQKRKENGPLIITLDGNSGSGKSTLANLLADALEESGCEVMRDQGGKLPALDMFVKDREWRHAIIRDLIRKQKSYDQEIDFYDWHLIENFSEMLRKFTASRKAETALFIPNAYDQKTKKRSDRKFRLTRNMVVIIEGQFSNRLSSADLRYRVVNERAEALLKQRVRENEPWRLIETGEYYELALRPSFEKYLKELTPVHFVIDLSSNDPEKWTNLPQVIREKSKLDRLVSSSAGDNFTRSEVRKSTTTEPAQAETTTPITPGFSAMVMKSKATNIKPWQVLRLEQDVIVVVEQAKIDTLSSEMFKELLEIAGLNNGKLHLVIPDAIQGKYSERVAELRKVASVYDRFPQIAASNKIPVIGFSDMEHDTLANFQKRLGPRLAGRVKDSAFGLNQAGSFGVGILYALKDIPPDRLLPNQNGFRYDHSGLYLAQVLKILQAYTVISASA